MMALNWLSAKRYTAIRSSGLKKVLELFKCSISYQIFSIDSMQYLRILSSYNPSY